jgi:predicted ATPase
VHSAFHPFIRHIERMAGIVRTDSGTQKLDKLEASLAGSAEVNAEAAPLIASLLSIPFGDRYPPLQITELVQKQRTMASIEEQLVLQSARSPLLLLFEDAHWIDPTSLQLIGRIIRRAVDLPAMIIVTHRPEFGPPWLELGHVTMLRLNSLDRSQAAQLVQAAADGKTLPAPIVEQIVAKSQGVPFVRPRGHAVDLGVGRARRGERPLCAARFRSGTSPSRRRCRTP